MKELNVLYATNANYLTITLASILSLIENAKIPTLHFHIITENFSDADYQIVENFFHQYSHITYHLYPVDEFNLAQYEIPFWHGTQVANARLFFQDIMQTNLDQIDHLLYLDSDTIVVDELTSLSEYQDGIYVVRDNATYSYYEKFSHLDDYFNSGVMYMDISTWKQENYQTKIIDFIKNNPLLNLTYPDQDILNCVLANQVNWLPMSYNLSPYAYIFSQAKEKIFFNPSKRKMSLEETNEAKKNPIIFHSYGLAGIKPWMNNSVNPFNDIYMYYVNRIDQDYQKKELTLLKKMITYHPEWFYDLLLLKTYLPEALQEQAKKMILYLHDH